jgi:hypothetical protein
MLATQLSTQPNCQHTLPQSLTQQQFPHDAAHTPHVEGALILGVTQQTLNGAVPQRDNLWEVCV